MLGGCLVVINQLEGLRVSDYCESKYSKKKDLGFYSHMTHGSIQKQEESVKVIGNPGNTGLPDSYGYKKMKFYKNVKKQTGRG